MQNNKAFYVVVSVLMLAGAGVITWFTMRKTDTGGTTDATTNWMCDGCGEVYKLTDAQLAKWDEDPKRFERRPLERMGHAMTIYYCDKCKQMAVVTAEECPTHQTWSVLRHIDGSEGGCAECAKELKRRR